MDTQELINKHNAHNKTIKKAAKVLKGFMIESGLNSLSADNVTVKIREVISNAGCAHDQIELVVSSEYDLYSVCLEDEVSATNESRYEYSDYNCLSIRPTRNQLLQFNAALPALIKKFEELAG